jgi:hypothetical protein
VGRLSTLRGMRHAAQLLAALNGEVGEDGCGDVATFLWRQSFSEDPRRVVSAALAAMLAHHSRARRKELGLPVKPQLTGLQPKDLYSTGVNKPVATHLSVQGGSVVAFHGTASRAEAFVDFQIGIKKPLAFGEAVRSLVPNAEVPPELEKGRVAGAAWRWFATGGGLDAAKLGSASAPVVFVGHSLGSVTASLAAAVALCLTREPVSLVTIGPPRAYDAAFCTGLQSRLHSSFHVANVLDVVPSLRGLRSLCSCCPSVVLRSAGRRPDLVHDLVHYAYSLALSGTSTASLWAPCCGGSPSRVALDPFGPEAVARAEARCPAGVHPDKPVVGGKASKSTDRSKMSRR